MGSPFHDRIHCLHGDVRNYPFKDAYDFIITNPPFHQDQLRADTAKENLAKHSSHLKLSELLRIIPLLLQPQGACSIMLPVDRMDELQKSVALHGLYLNEVLLIKHSPGHKAKVFAGILSFRDKGFTDQVFIIRENGSYTTQMKDLMDTYYL